jgi:hypothetical protein
MTSQTTTDMVVIGAPFPLDEPPYYAFPTAPNVAAIFSGVQINTDAQVVDRKRRSDPRAIRVR